MTDISYFGRDPTTDDLLNRHLARTGAGKTAKQDPAAQMQVAILRDFLRVLRSALDDEHVHPDTTRRVIERVMYGGVPHPAMTEQIVAERTGFAQAMSVDNRPITVNIKDPM